MPKLLSDRIEEFINWLREETDFGMWDEKVQDEVHKKLITCMISDPIEKPPSRDIESDFD